ncbi:MAG TPA: hypothetical protein VJX67_16550, partial [Blastocatellia bacterium]|nr:hypothetical protein [Blastocatellia bacterium]
PAGWHRPLTGVRFSQPTQFQKRSTPWSAVTAHRFHFSSYQIEGTKPKVIHPARLDGIDL